MNNTKGQWFLISAVIASTAFLSISFLFKTYFTTSATSPARLNEDYYFHNIRGQFDNVIKQSDCTDMTGLDRSVREFRAFAEKGVGNLGYLLYLNYSFTSCPNDYTLGLMVASNKMIVCQNVSAGELIHSSVRIDCS